MVKKIHQDLDQVQKEMFWKEKKQTIKMESLELKDTKKDAKKEKADNGDVGLAAKILIRPLLSVRRLSVNYTENKTTVIPGYTQNSRILGMNPNFSAPGWQFIAGFQPSFSQGGFLDPSCFERLDK